MKIHSSALSVTAVVVVAALALTVAVKISEDMERAQWTFNEDDYYYEITGDGFTIKCRDGTSPTGKISVPEMVRGIKIVGIGDCAFQGADITAISLPATTKHIGFQGFSSCKKLVSVSMPCVERISYNAFWGCDSLKTAYMPAVKHVDDFAFRDCASLESIYLPEVTEIGEYAFSRCDKLRMADVPSLKNLGNGSFSFSGLTTIDMPSIESIDAAAFYLCKNLSKVRIPATTTTIMADSFGGCNNFKFWIDVDESNPNYRSFDGMLFDKGMTTIITGRNVTSLELPDNVKTVGNGAFVFSNKLYSISMPRVEKIGGYAFISSSVVSVKMPVVKEIGECAFSDCTKLRTVSLPKSLVNVNESAFSQNNNPEFRFSVDPGNPNYSSVNGMLMDKSGETLIAGCYAVDLVIPSTVKKIGNGAFIGQTSLRSVSMPSVITLENFVFASSGLKEVTMGNIKNIGTSAFSNCELRTVTIENCDAVEDIAFDAFINSEIGTLNFRNISNMAVAQEKIGDWRFAGAKNVVCMVFDTTAKIDAGSMTSIVDGNVKFISASGAGLSNLSDREGTIFDSIDGVYYTNDGGDKCWKVTEKP